MEKEKFLEIKKNAIYKYMKAQNKIQAKKFGWKKQTLKMQNDLAFYDINKLTIYNIDNFVNIITAKKLINFI